MGCTLLACEGPTVTVNVPDLLRSHVEMAVMVTDVGNDGAVNKPAVEIWGGLSFDVFLSRVARDSGLGEFHSNGVG
jgi:hypothetical protein